MDFDDALRRARSQADQAATEEQSEQQCVARVIAASEQRIAKVFAEARSHLPREHPRQVLQLRARTGRFARGRFDVIGRLWPLGSLLYAEDGTLYDPSRSFGGAGLAPMRAGDPRIAGRLHGNADLLAWLRGGGVAPETMVCTEGEPMRIADAVAVTKTIVRLDGGSGLGGLDRGTFFGYLKTSSGPFRADEAESLLVTVKEAGAESMGFSVPYEYNDVNLFFEEAVAHSVMNLTRR